jgi:hypothetical protein
MITANEDTPKLTEPILPAFIRKIHHFTRCNFNYTHYRKFYFALKYVM